MGTTHTRGFPVSPVNCMVLGHYIDAGLEFSTTDIGNLSIMQLQFEYSISTIPGHDALCDQNNGYLFLQMAIIPHCMHTCMHTLCLTAS